MPAVALARDALARDVASSAFAASSALEGWRSPRMGVALAVADDATRAWEALSRRGVMEVMLTDAHCAFLADAYPDDALKDYVVERKTIGSQLTLGACGWRLFRCAVVSYQRPVQEWLDAVERSIRAEEEGEEPVELPTFDYVEPTRATVRAFARDSLVAVTRRVVEGAVCARSTERLSAKLCKDIKYSARRKAQRVSWERGMGKFAQSANMFRTSALASVVNVSGEFIVDVGLATYFSIQATRVVKKGSVVRAWRRAVIRASCKAVAALVAGASAVAAFALCRPRGASPRVVTWGTYAALTAGELTGAVFIAPELARLIDDATGDSAAAAVFTHTKYPCNPPPHKKVNAVAARRPLGRSRPRRPIRRRVDVERSSSSARRRLDRVAFPRLFARRVLRSRETAKTARERRGFIHSDDLARRILRREGDGAGHGELGGITPGLAGGSRGG